MADVVTSNYITTTGGISALRQNGASIAASNGKGRYFRSASLQPGTAVATCQIFDNTSATGDPICDLQGAANDKTVQSMDYRYPLTTGLWVVLTGTGAPHVVIYIE